jgi:enolase
MKIREVRAIQILDSRGTPTIEVRLTSNTGTTATYSVPAGASKGEHEATELRDGNSSYHGQSVSVAIEVITKELTPEIIRRDFSSLRDFDDWLITIDPSPQKTAIGGNSTLALSGAFAHLAALENKQSLWQYFQSISLQKPAFPHIFANLVNGGKHAPGLDIQEFMIVPKSTTPSTTIAQIYDFHTRLQKNLVEQYGPSAKLVGDEGGMAPAGATTSEILEIIHNLRDHKTDPAIALDVAASSFYNGTNYTFEGQDLSSQDWSARLSGLASKYNITSLEDPFAETDTQAFIDYASAHPSSLIVGDDITVTNPRRIAELAKKQAIRGVIIKPNQIGTLSETIDAIETARQHALSIIISHRSGETNDHLIIDLAYGFAVDAVKIGAPRRGERVEKYNRLLEIEAHLA